jgi:DNA-binding response OmpR family regulator
MSNKEKSQKILLIEDTQTDFELIKAKVFGHEITWAKTLAEGLEQNKTDVFSLILLDLGLPDSFGIETLETLMKSNKHHTSVLILTSMNDGNIEGQAFLAGAKGFFPKSEVFKGESLSRVIKNTLLFQSAQKKDKNEEKINSRFRILYERLSNIFFMSDIMNCELFGELGHEKYLQYTKEIRKISEEQMKIIKEMQKDQQEK